MEYNIKGPVVFNEQRVEFTLMPDFLATCETHEHPHTCGCHRIMFGPELIAMEMTSLDPHPRCCYSAPPGSSSWNLLAVAGRAAPPGAQRLPGGVCKVRLTSGHF